MSESLHFKSYEVVASNQLERERKLVDARTGSYAKSVQATTIDASLASNRIGTVFFGVGLGLAIQAGGYSIAGAGNVDLGLYLFFAGVAVVFSSCAWRLLGAPATRVERVHVSLILGLALVVSTYLASPLIYDHTFDSVLHQTTYWQIADLRSLFSTNTTLPISPHYPGLELLTAAVKWTTGLPLVLSDLVVMLIARFVLVAALFLFAERITHSSRAASTAVVVYACSPEFYLYNSEYLYQTLGIAFGAAAIYFLLLALHGIQLRLNVALSVGSIAGVTVTHHLIGWLTVSCIVVWAIVMSIEAHRNQIRAESAKILRNVALIAVMISAAWTATASRVLYSYLGPILSEAWDGVLGLINNSSKKRTLFYNNGIVTPRWQELLVVISVLITIGLVIGGVWSAIFRRSINGGLQTVLPIAVTLAYAIVLVAPLTGGSAFVGQRMSTFVFFGIALLSAAWSLQLKRHISTPLIVSLATVFFIGSLIFGAGPSWTYLRGPYVPVGDQRSFNSPSLAAATWASEHLPVNSITISDRDNSVLLAAVGHLEPLTELANGVNAGWIVFGSKVTSFDVSTIRRYDIRYIVTDRRLLAGPPAFGLYFDDGSPPPGVANRLTAEDLNKFTNDPKIQEIYDNGSIQIYDTAKLLGTVSPATPISPIGSGGAGMNLWVFIPWLLVAGAWISRAWRRRSLPSIEELLKAVVGGSLVAIALAFAVVPTRIDTTPIMIGLFALLFVALSRTNGWTARSFARMSSYKTPRRKHGAFKVRTWFLRRQAVLATVGLVAFSVALFVSISSDQRDMAPVTTLTILQTKAHTTEADVMFASRETRPAFLEVQTSNAILWTRRLKDTMHQRVVVPNFNHNSSLTRVVVVVDGSIIRSVTDQ